MDKRYKSDEGIIVIIWYSEGGSVTLQPIGFSLEAGETKEYEIEPERLNSPGNFEYRWCIRRSPKYLLENRLEDDFQEGNLAFYNHNITKDDIRDKHHKLFSYHVRDKSNYKHELELRRSQKDHQCQMWWMTFMMFLLALTSVGITLLNIFVWSSGLLAIY